MDEYKEITISLHPKTFKILTFLASCKGLLIDEYIDHLISKEFRHFEQVIENVSDMMDEIKRG